MRDVRAFCPSRGGARVVCVGARNVLAWQLTFHRPSETKLPMRLPMRLFSVRLRARPMRKLFCVHDE